MDDFRAETARRFDALEARVDEGFADTKAEFAGVRGEMKAEFTAVRGETKAEFAGVRAEVREGFDKVDRRFEKIDERFDRLHGLLLRTCVSAVGLLGVLVTVIGIKA